MRLRFLVPILFLTLTGCASLDSSGRRWAMAQPQVCKHCNCALPAGVDPASSCTVCDCGYKAGRCIRGSGGK